MTTMMIALMTMTRVVSCNPSGNDSAQLIWESGQLISPPPADCPISYSTFWCVEEIYKTKYINQSICKKMRQKRFLPTMFNCSSPKLLSWLLMTIQRVQKSLYKSRLSKILYCNKRGGVCFWWENEMIHFDFLISSAINLISTKPLLPELVQIHKDCVMTMIQITLHQYIKGIILLLSWSEGK